MNLRHIRLILKREYTQRLRSTGFILGTILGIVGIAALSFLPALINLISHQDTVKIAVVDPKNLVYRYLPVDTGASPTPVSSTGLQQSPISPAAGIKFLMADTSDETALSQRVKRGDINAYLTVDGTSASDARFSYHAKDRPNSTDSARLLGLLSAAAIQGRLHESGIGPEKAAALFGPPAYRVEPVVAGTLKDEKVYFQSVALVYILLVLLYTTMLMYGIQVAMGVVEEKSSRVMEVLITSVRPIELMIGKVLGVGLVGLTQYALWVAVGFLTLVLSTVFGKSSGSAATGIDIASVPATTLIFFLVFFVLGYLLFASIYGALGSLVNRSEEVNGITTPVTIIMVGTYLLSIAAIGNPDAEFVRWLSFVPFFTPMLMFIRVALSSPDLWELLLSVALLAATSLLFAWVAAKIYRVGVLLYGKRPSFREIGRFLRTA